MVNQIKTENKENLKNEDITKLSRSFTLHLTRMQLYLDVVAVALERLKWAALSSVFFEFKIYLLESTDIQLNSINRIVHSYRKTKIVYMLSGNKYCHLHP